MSKIAVKVAFGISSKTQLYLLCLEILIKYCQLEMCHKHSGVLGGGHPGGSL